MTDCQTDFLMLSLIPPPPQELVRLCGAEERELRGAGVCGEPQGARAGPLPILPARLPATSDVSIREGRGGRGGGGVLDV